MTKYVYGVDIGGTTIKIGRFTVNGKLEQQWEIPTRTKNHGSYIIEDIAKSILDNIKDNGIVKEEVCGIGMGVPGPVDDFGGIARCVNLGWEGYDATGELEEKTGLPTCTGNDANVAALGEQWQGGAKGFSDMVMITLGTGIGGGIIIGGEILSGRNGAAGEFGHFPVCEDEEEYCGCGKKGCLEQYASANGIVRVAKRILKKRKEYSVLRELMECQELTSKKIFEAVKEKDVLALDIVDETARQLGKACATISCVIDPDIYVVGGGMSAAGEEFLLRIQSYYRKYAFGPSAHARFALAELQNQAGIYGAAKLMVNKVRYF